ncbi:MAG: ShlB/FhaC/HecB family hemolysin secretion/activation protein [Leptothrix ochracea]|uniref:ShlB/FhaC/HecB family hemolysin secretion/activation protein n=1 Tax=Leptothrix ochracea TaxID=735331 RepID=UPI0034E22CAA
MSLQPRIYSLPLVLAFATVPVGVRAVTPDGGDVSRQVVPSTAVKPSSQGEAQAMPKAPTEPEAVPLQNGLKVKVKALHISGASAFSETTLLTILEDAQGIELDFNQLQALADRITAHYRTHGYLLAKAYLPAQKIADGSIQFAVLEGQLGQLGIETQGAADNPRALAVNPTQVAPFLADLRPGQALQSAPLERDLLVLSDLPGVKVQSVLRPGETVGTSNLDVKVQSERAINASATLDNYGSRYTGELRASARINVASPFRFGDSLDATATYAGAGFRYGRLAWQTPVGGRGLQLGVAGSLMGYALGQEFASLNASGQASDLTLYALQPLVRSRSSNVQAQGALDIKHFDDLTNGAHTLKQVQVLSLGLSGNHPTAWGASSQGSLTLTLGRLVLDGANAAQDASGYRTNGNYAKLGFQGDYNHPLTPTLANTTLGFKLSGQAAGKNLDSSEKMSLGGPQSVRAYAAGEGSSDHALMANIELRRVWDDNLQAKVFVDAARGFSTHTPLATETLQPRDFSGAGLGLDMQLPYSLVFQTAVAWRLSGMPSPNLDRSPRLWALITKNF